MCQQESVFVFAREKGTHGTHIRLSCVLQYVAHIVYVHELSYVLHYVAHMRVKYVFHVQRKITLSCREGKALTLSVTHSTRMRVCRCRGKCVSPRDCMRESVYGRESVFEMEKHSPSHTLVSECVAVGTAIERVCMRVTRLDSDTLSCVTHSGIRGCRCRGEGVSPSVLQCVVVCVAEGKYQ